MHNLKQLRRLRWLVLVAVLLGIAASIAMNVLHAPPSLAARLVAVGPPVAVFVCLELISRIPSSSKARTRSRIAGAAVAALTAATISYAQQRAAVLGLGFAPWEAWIWPLTIDGVMIVASISLVEVVAKVREMSDPAYGAGTQPAGLRAAADLQESAEVLAYRASVAKMRQESQLAALNGSRSA